MGQSSASAVNVSQESQDASDIFQNDGHNAGVAPANIDPHLGRTVSGMLSTVQAQQRAPKVDNPLELWVLDVQRREVIDPTLTPATVLLHVYDLKPGKLQAANDILAFTLDEAAVGGAFHVGVEVFGSEWCYGTSGMRSDLPRTITGHAYRCSLLLGETRISKEQFAAELVDLCQRWKGQDYHFAGHNCCGFARDLTDKLDVGPLPPWVDRLARVLDTGLHAAEKTKNAAGFVGDFVEDATQKVIETLRSVNPAHCHAIRLPYSAGLIKITRDQVSLESEPCGEGFDVLCPKGHAMGEVDFETCDLVCAVCTSRMAESKPSEGMACYRCVDCEYALCSGCTSSLAKSSSTTSFAAAAEPVYVEDTQSVRSFQNLRVRASQEKRKKFVCCSLGDA